MSERTNNYSLLVILPFYFYLFFLFGFLLCHKGGCRIQVTNVFITRLEVEGPFKSLMEHFQNVQLAAGRSWRREVSFY